MSKKGVKESILNPDSRVPTVLDVEILDYIPKIRTDQRKQRINEKISSIFQIFGSDTSETCDVRDVGVITRAVGLNPSESDVLQIIEDIEGAESTGSVSLAKLREILVSILVTNEYKGRLFIRDSEERILAAFEALDADRKGYIDADYLKHVMTSMGERFSADEVVELVTAAADPDTGRVYYEDFAAILANE